MIQTSEKGSESFSSKSEKRQPALCNVVRHVFQSQGRRPRNVGLDIYFLLQLLNSPGPILVCLKLFTIPSKLPWQVEVQQPLFWYLHR